MAQYVTALGTCPAARVLSEHEPGLARARDSPRTARGSARMLALLDLAAWQRYERWVLRQVDATVAFTERDHQALEPLAGGRAIVTIPLGSSLPPASLDPLGMASRSHWPKPTVNSPRPSNTCWPSRLRGLRLRPRAAPGSVRT
jgi:hypothetical protein